MKVVFSGKMAMTRDRETEKFEDMGITVQKGVTKGTDYLVIGYDYGMSKYSKAQRYDIDIIQEDDFFELLLKEFPEYLL